MNTITVYRIENKAGHGFYNCDGKDITQCPTYRQDHEKHPPASREIMKTLRDKGWPTNMIFGFESLEKLKTWVHREDWAQFLDENGFDICGFKISEQHVLKDDVQVVFDRHEAEIFLCDSVHAVWSKI